MLSQKQGYFSVTLLQIGANTRKTKFSIFAIGKTISNASLEKVKSYVSTSIFSTFAVLMGFGIERISNMLCKPKNIIDLKDFFNHKLK